MVLLSFVWKCFQERNFHGVVVRLYEQSIESSVGLGLTFKDKVSVIDLFRSVPYCGYISNDRNRFISVIPLQMYRPFLVGDNTSLLGNWLLLLFV